MKKKLTRIIAVLLSLLLLSGCSAEYLADFVEDYFSELISSVRHSIISMSSGVEKFSDIEYVRPDIEQISADFKAVTEALELGADIDELGELLDTCYTNYFSFETMYTLADIRSCQNVYDTYYAEELSWCSENYSLVQQQLENVLYACAASELAEELEEQYFWEGFTEDYADASDSYYNDEAVALMQQESLLLSEYRALAADSAAELAALPHGGDSYSLTCEVYARYNEDFARIYIELVRVREALAELYGLDYEHMQYIYFFERDYTPEDAAAYLEDIRRCMVPVYTEIMAQNPYSEVYFDYLSENELLNTLDAVTELMGGEIRDAFEFMTDYEMYDIAYSQSKAAMSFQTYLSDYEAPFLFLDPYGDTEDILTLSHEFGHYTDAFVNYNASETIDMSECYSQAMEYLALSYYDEVMSAEDAANLRRIKLLDTLELYVQQASFAEFESRVYAMGADALSAEVLNDLSLELARDYGYLGEGQEEYYAMSWSDITHFFDYPFYIITYPVSNDIAMQVYELAQSGGTAGLEKYKELLSREYEGFLDNIEEAGFKSPFAPGRIERVAEDMRYLMRSAKAA